MPRTHRDTRTLSPTWNALQNAHQLGVLSRVTRKVVKCRTLNDIGGVVATIAEHLELTGLFRARSGDELVTRNLGKGLDHYHARHLAMLGRCRKKVQCCKDAAVFYTENLLLIIDTRELTEDHIGMLKDNLMILVETLEFWFYQHAELASARAATLAARVDISERINDIVSSMLRFSEHLTEHHKHLSQNLLTQLMLALPTLGLDPDQEESMIHMVTRANNDHGELIDLQLHHNGEMREIMEEAMSVLLTDEDSEEFSTNNDLNEDDDITLF